jgi:RNA polymerase sigma-70 factor (ECF subfamily)
MPPACSPTRRAPRTTPPDATGEVTRLVRDAKAGDRAAFGELVRRFEGAVYAIALRKLGRPLEAEELAQEVFIKAYEKLDQLKVPAAFGGWLRAITVRLAINRMVRKTPVLSAEPELLEATCADIRNPLDDVLAAERRAQVRAGLKRLGTMDRETLVAFYVRGQSLLEMSEEFDSPVGTIKRRLHVARKRLAKELESLAV